MYGARQDGKQHQQFKNIIQIGKDKRYNSKELPLMVDVSTRYIIYVKGDKKLLLKLVAFTVTAATN